MAGDARTKNRESVSPQGRFLADAPPRQWDALFNASFQRENLNSRRLESSANRSLFYSWFFKGVNALDASLCAKKQYKHTLRTLTFRCNYYITCTLGAVICGVCLEK
jgi:hypothetical protein